MENSSTVAGIEYIPLKMEENHVTGPIKSQIAGSELLYGIAGFGGGGVFCLFWVFYKESYSEGTNFKLVFKVQI